jgi:hypothetical protein
MEFVINNNKLNTEQDYITEKNIKKNTKYKDKYKN